MRWLFWGGLTLALAYGIQNQSGIEYFQSILTYAGINALLATSLNLVSGFTGQFSMGHAGFMSVGGYSSAWLALLLCQKFPELSLDPVSNSLIFLVCLLFGGFQAALAGYLVGLPSLRLKGDYLAIVTLGFGEIIRVVILNTDSIGGPRGLAGIPAWTTLPWVYGILACGLFYMWRLLKSSKGRAFLAVREDEIAASSLGVYTTQAKVRAFVTGAFFAGVAGALFAHSLSYLNPQTFDFNRSFEAIIMVVLGGMGSLSGSVLAAFLLTGLKEVLRLLKDQGITQLDYRMVVYSLALLALMLTRPKGLFGKKELEDLFPRIFKRGGFSFVGKSFK